MINANSGVAQAVQDALRQAARSANPVARAVHDAIAEISVTRPDQRQDHHIALHRKHIQALWRHLARIEQFIEPNPYGELCLSVGAASITLKKNGDVLITGNNIKIDAAGRAIIKASMPPA